MSVSNAASRASGTATAQVPPDVVERIRRRRDRAGRHLDDTVVRRTRSERELSRSKDPVDQEIARVYRDFLRQVDDVRRSRASLLLAADERADTIVGRVAVFDDTRDLVLVPWHAPEGQRLLTAPDRLLVAESPDGEVAVHRLTADERALADRIREQMRLAADREEMSDPLATLTQEQGGVLARIGEHATADRDVLLTGPPGSGKSAIAMVELARRILTDPTPHERRVLFVTGTTRLAARAEALGRMLGVASITPVPQDRLLRTLGVGDVDTPIAGRSGEADAAALPEAIEDTFAELRDRLARSLQVPHPLGVTDAADLAAVRATRAAAATTSYADSARALRDRLVAEYTAILPGDRSEALAHAAAAELRPSVPPTELVARATRRARLPRAIKATAMALARDLLEAPPSRPTQPWDLVVVDEYQRLPAVVLALLRRRSARVLLSGDPKQAFTSHDLAHGLPDAAAVELSTSLRLPSSIGGWIDGWWAGHGLEPPRIACAATGGQVVEVAATSAAPDHDGAQVIAAAGEAARHDGWLHPLDALGLEWPHVVLVEPERILAEHGEAGLFVAATRAIDRLTVVSAEATA